ncbi:MAG: hypothetical protein U0800_03830 [Isosphaeraceae bacterium]
MATLHRTSLERLPAGLSWPGDLADRVSYDPSKHTLSFAGYMSKSTFDRLANLSDDWDYRDAVERLFQESLPESDPIAADRPRRWFFAWK